MTPLGVVLTTISAILFLLFLFLDLAGLHSNPYLGIVTFLLLPMLFVIGLLLIPFGLWRGRRRTAAGHGAAPWPVVDFARATVRRWAILILVLTAINVAIVTTAAFKVVEYADSTPFCTGVCHTPMRPEAIAHQQTAHANVSCVSCHIGPGPQGFVEAKLGGVRRLAGVISGDYERPIPVPVHDLPSAVGTCISCHSSERFIGERTRRIRSYSDDETTSEQVTTLTFHVGGGGHENGGPHGIHWHASPQTRIEYVTTDATRETIPWVRVSDRRGTREYTADGVSAAQVAAGERRVMDCTDCHNRVGHRIAPTAERAVDDALATGFLPRLPFVRREAIAALSVEYPDEGAAQLGIAQRLQAFYAQQPRRSSGPRVAQAVSATQAVYARNVFPAMNVTWGRYPSQLGHSEAPGCFRCHDERKSADGRVITQDCEACHRME